MFPASFEYVAPHSLQKALELLTRHGDDAKLLAGGHSLIPAMKLRLTAPHTLIDLAQIPGLRGVREENGNVIIGALTVHSDVASAEAVGRLLPGLATAASGIGDWQVRNRGTIGGSIAHADPAADLPVILTALNASFVLVSSAGKRNVSVDEFFIDYYTTALAANEVLTEIVVPLSPSGTGTAYAKLENPASRYVVVSAGVQLTRRSSGQCESARIAIGGLGSGPVRAQATEMALQGMTLTREVIAAVASKAADGTNPDGDIYASADYKRQMAAVYTRRAMEEAVDRMGESNR